MHSVDKYTHLSLFSGIGGLDIAAEMAGFKTVGQCEWADYPTKVLEKHWPDVPRWRDIQTLTGGSYYERTGLRTVDVISGGFPCQPFSVAGKRRGKDDDRYLWPEMLRVIQEIRPSWVVGENVAGIVNLALDTVLSDLESIGYACQAFIIPACAVDAAHRRDRCAIVARTNGGRQLHREYEKHTAEAWEHAQRQSERCCENVANSKSIGLQGKRSVWEQVCGTRFDEEELERYGHVSRINNRNCGWRTVKSRLGGVVDGVPAWMDRYWVEEPDISRLTTNKKNRVDRLKCLGNAVYWRQFYPIFQAIREVEEMYGRYD